MNNHGLEYERIGRLRSIAMQRIAEGSGKPAEALLELENDIEALLRERDEWKARAAWNALPRALEWTDEPPKVPGWYWQKGGMFSDKRIILLSNADLTLYPEVSFMGKHGVFQWAGPIPEPK